MNQDQVTSIVRQVLLAVGGGSVGAWLAAKFGVTPEAYSAIVGALAIISGSVWAIYTRRPSGLVASAAKLDEVGKVIADPAIANGTLKDNPKVQAS